MLDCRAPCWSVNGVIGCVLRISFRIYEVLTSTHVVQYIFCSRADVWIVAI